MDPSISDLAVLSPHPPRCLSLSHRRHHPYYPLDDCMGSEDSTSTSDRGSDLNSADMQQQQQQQQHSGTLSLHHYRKALYSDADGCVVLDIHGRRKLKRKNGASNLHTPSVSGTSSPPPLSPSYSMTMSVTSQRSDVDPDGVGFCMLGSWSSVEGTCADAVLVSGASSPQNQNQNRNPAEHAIPWRISNRLNTFRDRLRKPSLNPNPNPNPTTTPRPNHSHSKARSDSILLDVKHPNPNSSLSPSLSPSPSPKPTMVHHGTSFEILNPHDSLNYARIVSYIEDVDYASVSVSSEEEEEERLRESFLEGGSCASTAVGTVISETAVANQAGSGLESGTSRNASPASPAAEDEDEVPQRRHSDLVGDAAAHVPLPSISERLATSSPSAVDGGASPVSSVSVSVSVSGVQGPGWVRGRSDTLVSGPSEIGEPGPVVEDGCLSSSSSSSSSSRRKPRQDRGYSPAYSSSPARKPERDCSTACSYYFSPGDNRSVQPAIATPRPGSEMRVRARPGARLRERAVTRLRGVLGGLPFFRRSR